MFSRFVTFHEVDLCGLGPPRLSADMCSFGCQKILEECIFRVRRYNQKSYKSSMKIFKASKVKEQLLQSSNFKVVPKSESTIFDARENAKQILGHISFFLSLKKY